jgi:hypothetical protein
MRRIVGLLVLCAGISLFTDANEDGLHIGDIWVKEWGAWKPVIRSTTGPQPISPQISAKPSIYVAVASFRDTRCGQTIVNLLSKAKYPERIRIGIVQQNLDGDVDCIAKYCEIIADLGKDCLAPGAQLRALRLNAQEAEGPVWGRHWQQYMLNDEEFCMQIDSHMDVVQDWDEKMAREWLLTHNEYAVLSTYVQGFPDRDRNVNGHWEVPHLCEVRYTSQVRNGSNKALRHMIEPNMASTWAAGYSFSKCHGMRAVPYDPYLPQIFDGEEFSIFARLWTRGYDVYSPSRSYVFHDYSKDLAANAQDWNRPSEKRNVEKNRALSNTRLWTLLGMPMGEEDADVVEAIRFGPWGLGRARSLDALMSFTGLDLEHKDHFGDTRSSCTGLKYAPIDMRHPPGSEDNIKHAPHWPAVRELMLKDGVWFPEDEDRMRQYFLSSGEINSDFPWLLVALSFVGLLAFAGVWILVPRKVRQSCVPFSPDTSEKIV